MQNMQGPSDNRTVESANMHNCEGLKDEEISNIEQNQQRQRKFRNNYQHQLQE